MNVSGAGLRDVEIRRGDWMVAEPVASSTRRIDVEVRVLADEPRALANRTPVHVHIGAADVTGRLVTHDGGDIAPGASALAQIMLDHALHTLRGDRLVLRDQSARRTVGGGVVIDPAPDMRSRNREERRAYLEAMAEPNAQLALPAALAALPGGMDLAAFMRSWNLDATQRAAVLQTPGLKLCGSPDLAIGDAHWQRLEALTLDALDEQHRAHPERLGVGERELEKALRARLLRGVFAALIDSLVGAGRVVRDGAVLRLPTHSARRSAADDALWKRVQPLLASDAMKAPVVHDLAAALNHNHSLLEAFLIRVAKEGGLVVKVSAKRYASCRRPWRASNSWCAN
ncbi:MAG: hypothetical protein IPG43_24560 [Proteobacteria bacterium]|nr:hypothetical protein [Pseudomonadota bacterium]